MDDTAGHQGIPRWTATVATDQGYTLGEGPLWDPYRGRLLWVDIVAGSVHSGRLHPDRIEPAEHHQVADSVGAVVCSVDGDLLIAGLHELIVRTAAGDIETAPDIVIPASSRRLNDGACDPAGRFLVGTLDRAGARGRETLTRVERDGALTTIDDDLTLSNGLAWSPDGRLLYSIDSVPGTVWRRDYEPDGDRIGERRVWLEIADGTPDGMCIDVEGCAWIAIHGRGQVRRYSPGGDLIGVVDVAAPHTTSVAFAGDAYDQLVITTATDGLAPADLDAYPCSGRLFRADVGVTGLPATPWAGR
ncbi:MAG TPA: SMP-30/gluconolactonase/LRE family protein [Micromonosporaceae bacterium]|jgi:sugar lactone lactonase YvrE